MNPWRRRLTEPRWLVFARVAAATSLGVGIWKVAVHLQPKSEPSPPPVAARPLPAPTPAPTPSPPKPKSKSELLARAVDEGDVDAARALLKRGDDEPGGKTLLSHAAFSGDLKMAKLLLRYGADVNPRYKVSPLAWASYDGENALPMMRLLIRAGAKVNARFYGHTTVLSIARFHGGPEAEALLKRHGARR